MLLPTGFELSTGAECYLLLRCLVFHWRSPIFTARSVKTKDKRACPVRGTALGDDSDLCPICALQGALKPENDSVSDSSSEFRFEHYQFLRTEDGTPVELGRGAMGVTYKAVDVNFEGAMELKAINVQFVAD